MSATDPPPSQPTHGDILAAISDGMVALLKEFYGRGPTRAKSYYQDDLVVCLLRGGFSQVERPCSRAAEAPRSSSSEWSSKTSCAAASRPSSSARPAVT